MWCKGDPVTLINILGSLIETVPESPRFPLKIPLLFQAKNVSYSNGEAAVCALLRQLNS